MKVKIILCGWVAILGLWTSQALAQKKSVAEEILDILRAKSQISEQQYRDLLNKARAESERTETVVDLKETVVNLQEKVEQAPKAVPNSLNVFWKEGLRMEAADGDFKLRIGGRVQQDWVMYSTDRKIRDAVNGGKSIGDGVEFRRARLNIQGNIYRNTAYRLELDFAGGEVAFKDAYIEVLDIPYVGTYTVGHYKEPFSLEELTSSRFITFMERSLPNAFAPSRNTGMKMENSLLNEQATWAVGFFRELDDTGTGFGPDDNYNITARATAVPWRLGGGEQLVHLGVSYSHKFLDGRDFRFRSRPETHLGPRFVDTASFAADGIDLVNPEFALVYGPASLQAEWTRAIVDTPEGSDRNFDGWYVYGSYFLTGEHRVYKTGAFDRVKPLRNFDGNGSWGAWEVGARYSYLDLNDGNDTRGGILGDFTLGINWYLNPNVRFMFNYVLADAKSRGEANIIETRFQADF